MYRRIIILVGLCVVLSSIATGLELTNTAGGNPGRSTVAVKYGAANGDSVEHHVKLNPSEGTAQNWYAGTGSLPYNYISISDNNGNWVVYVIY
jgi:hypothetical protein